MSAAPLAFPGSDPDAALIEISPAIAEKLLAKNTHNRNVRMSVVAKYAADMMAGRWLVTGESIKIAPDGTILDGQHRLRAIVMSGVTIETFVVRNLKPEVQEVLDSGVKRTAADALQLRGRSEATVLAAAAKWAILFDADALYGDRAAMGAKVSHSEILEYVEGNEELTDSIVLTSPLRRSIDVAPSITVTAFYLTMRVDPDAALEFFERLADGVGLPKGSPILAVRSRLREVRNSRQHLEGQALLSVIIRGWNAWRQGRSMSLIPVFRGNSSIHCPQPR